MEHFTKKYQEVTDVLLEYGWIMTPFIIGGDFDKIYKLVQIIKANPEPTPEERDNFQKNINFLFTDILFHPLFRAFFVLRSKEVEHLKAFSHHIERAIFHYYKHDYFSAIHCLLPAIEGSLLSYYGWNYGDARKPSINNLISEVEKCRAKTRDPLTYKQYAVTLASFLRKWIFMDTSTSDTSFSFLNRHYVLHGMGNDNYYSIADFHRIIMFFDIWIEYLSLEQNIGYVFIPDNNVQVDQRRDYYFKLIEEDISNKEIQKIEKNFLKENLNYYTEVDLPNWNDMVKRFIIEHIELIKRFNIK